MASGIYNRFKADLMNGVLDLVNDTINGALLDSNHSFTATDNTWSDVSANEISGTGYTAGGQALANKSVTQGSPTYWDADDLVWDGDATFDADHLVLYQSSTGDLICSFDFGGTESVSGGTFTVEFNTSGIIDLD